VAETTEQLGLAMDAPEGAELVPAEFVDAFRGQPPAAR
jgi:hypothetical protein